MKLTAAVLFLSYIEFSTAFLSQARPRNAFLSPKNTQLFGILDEIESDSYNLLSSSNDKEVEMDDAYEIFLAELVFSSNDPRVDIMNKFDLAADPEFLDWLENTKIAKSNDPEERAALRDLLEIIVDVKTRVEVNKLAEERAATEAEEAELQRIQDAEAEAAAGRQLSATDVLKKANAIQQQTTEEEIERRDKKKTFYEQELTPEIRLSYENLLKKVLPPYKPGDNPASIVFNYYDQFDAQFVKVLNERVDNGDADSEALLNALADEQQKRISSAASALKSVISLGDPMKMEGAIVKFAREGKVDEPFLLLLEANAQQAKSAGANDAAAMMTRLLNRAMDEKDKQSTSKEIRLIRKLLRTDDSSQREKLLEDAFTPKAALIVPGTAENAAKAADGEAPEQEQPMPDVEPPKFIDACKAVLLNFGNLGSDDEERGDLASRIKKIAGEAEVVATRIYGKGMTLREQQDRMWAEQTTSIFDLERMEIEAERMGERAPWTNPNADDEMLLPGFDANGRMKIGGS